MNSIKDLSQDRDIDLENIIGSLLVAEYQVDRLGYRLFCHLKSLYYKYDPDTKSTFTFQYNGRSFNVQVSIELKENEAKLESNDTTFTELGPGLE